jgi:hypothetical protein
MKGVITLITAVLCLGVVVSGTFSQQPRNPPKQKAETAKAAVSADVPTELQSAQEKLESAERIGPGWRRVGWASQCGSQEHR